MQVMRIYDRERDGAGMLILPIQTQDHRQDALIVVVDQTSISHMQLADPAEVVLRQTGKRLVNPTILFCFEKELASLNKFIHASDIKGLIKHLQRGWKFQPDKGDHDRGPESIYKQN